MAEIIPSRGKYIEITEKTAADVTADMTDPDTGTVIPLSRLLYYNPDSEEPEIITLGQGHSLLSKGQWDAVIDDAYTIHFSDTWPTIAEAIAAGAVSIFVRSAGDTAAITIASASAVQRVQGKDADTTELPVNVTCDKDDVTFEEFGLNGNTLTLTGGRTSVKTLYLTGAAVISASAGIGHVIERCRADGSATPFQAAINSTIKDNRAFGLTGPNVALFALDQAFRRHDVIGNIFLSLIGLTDYAIKTTGIGSLGNSQIHGNVIGSVDEGAISVVTEYCEISNNILTASALTTGKRLLQISSLAGTAIHTRVINNTFYGTAASNVLFECASADADAAGLILLGNTFRTGTILGSQNASQRLGAMREGRLTRTPSTMT